MAGYQRPATTSTVSRRFFEMRQKSCPSWFQNFGTFFKDFCLVVAVQNSDQLRVSLNGEKKRFVTLSSICSTKLTRVYHRPVATMQNLGYRRTRVTMRPYHQLAVVHHTIDSVNFNSSKDKKYQWMDSLATVKIMRHLLVVVFTTIPFSRFCKEVCICLMSIEFQRAQFCQSIFLFLLMVCIQHWWKLQWYRMTIHQWFYHQNQ